MDLTFDHRQPENSRREIFLVLLLLFIFVAINLTVATHTPTVYADEPGYTDPAANLYFGSGFTSTMWAQGCHEFWCGNVPLYEFILYATFKLFGFGLFQARAVNTCLAAAAAALIWAALRYSNTIRTSTGRILCLGLLLSGAVSTLTIRTIRPDTTMFFTCALVFFFSRLPLRLPYRCLWAAAASALLPFAGLPMLPYTGVMVLLVFGCLGLAEAALLSAIGLGVGAGIALLALFYNHFSSLETFVKIVLPFTVLGSRPATGPGAWHAKLLGDHPGSDNLFTSFFGNPASFVDQKTICDYSALLLFGLFLWVAISVWRAVDGRVRWRILFVVLLVTITPPLMHIVGHYRSMYRWMTFVPLTLAVPWILEQQPEILKMKWLKGMAIIFIGAAVFLGIPARTLVIIPYWAERSPTPLERTCQAMVHPEDVVVCSLKAWFSVRPHARLVYCCDLPARGEFSQTVDLPTNNISLLCLLPKDYENVVQAIGGRWQKIKIGEPVAAAALERTRYAVEFYRRISE